MTLTIDMRYPDNHRYAFPIKRPVRLEIDKYTQDKSLHSCDLSSSVHELIKHGIITSDTTILSVYIQRFPAPENYSLVTIITEDLK